MWAIVSRLKFENLNAELKLVATQRLTPKTIIISAAAVAGLGATAAFRTGDGMFE